MPAAFSFAGHQPRKRQLGYLQQLEQLFRLEGQTGELGR